MESLCASPLTAQLLGLLAEWPALPFATRLGALATGLALGVLAAWYYSRWKTPPPKEATASDPARLFAELCQAHRLSAAQQRLLEWLVAERQLLQPAVVFLEPILLESAIVSADTPTARKRLTELRGKLFAGLDTAALDNGPP